MVTSKTGVNEWKFVWENKGKFEQTIRVVVVC
jgi:hypothetical protein